MIKVQMNLAEAINIADPRLNQLFSEIMFLFEVNFGQWHTDGVDCIYWIVTTEQYVSTTECISEFMDQLNYILQITCEDTVNE